VSLEIRMSQKKFISRFLAASIVAFTAAAPMSALPITLADAPLFAGAAIAPQVMLDVSKDNQLFFKAYNDFSDLDGDGLIETTYKHGLDYYGYFDSYKCYSYSDSRKRFEPASVKSKAKTEGPGGTLNLAAKYCLAGSNQWSGNFLNWVSTARIDAIRKILYGGYRSTDTSTDTVLERVSLPMDAHSWAKYYNGSDIAKLTPFNPPTTAPSGTSNTKFTIPTLSASAPSATISFSTGLSLALGDQVKIRAQGKPDMYVIGGVSKVGSGSYELLVELGSAYGAGFESDEWNVTNLSGSGITFCNTTDAPSGQTLHGLNTVTYPPLIRVAKGNFSLWAANERWQCAWFEDSGRSNKQGGFSGGFRNNGNRANISGIDASAENPSSTTHGLSVSGAGPDFVARTQVCVTGSIGEERCKQYPNGNYKPVGLLETYGDTGLIQFGLMTGSYSKNISGGVLRKNTTSFRDEVNASTDGTFKTPALADHSTPGDPINTAAKLGSIVDTMNKLRVYGYDYTDGAYINKDGCTYQQIEITTGAPGSNQVSQGNCSAWGNPMGEILVESLRYFAGLSPRSDFLPSSGSKDETLGLKTVEWADPLNSNNYCAPLNALMFNPSVTTYDEDKMDMTGILGASSTTAKSFTLAIGNDEGITGQTFFIGNNSSTAQDDCTPKTISDFSVANGHCPEAASYNGTFLMAGAAHYAHTKRIRDNVTGVPADDTSSLKVSTYGIQLATNTPQIRIPDPDDVSRTAATLLPAYRLDLGTGKYGGGTIVDFKIVNQNYAAGTGKFYVVWEDSGFGGDFDQDVVGTLSYCVKTASTTCPAVNGSTPSNGTISVTTDVVAASTANPQGFGYIISGTKQDGVHFPSGIYNFNYPTGTFTTGTPAAPNSGLGSVRLDSSGVIGCANCNIADARVTWIYTLGTTSAGILKDPMWYAAKWGGFKDDKDSPTGKPDAVAKWDRKRADGSPGSDGVPDNYFYVTNPFALEAALDQAFTKILEKASASSVATNSTRLNTGSIIYQGQFNSADWSGRLVAFNVDNDTGSPLDPARWDAGQVLSSKTANQRAILTMNDETEAGVAFRWSSVSAAQQAALNTTSSGTTDTNGAARLDYVRGDGTNETTALGFRKRLSTKLGDVAHSNPVFVGAPSAGAPGAAYASFRSTYLNRTPMVYVGANDGMLHGFDGTTGEEKIAYVPTSVYRNLSRLTEPTYNNSHRFFVDGSPTVREAQIGSTWKTLLAGSLRAGGQGIFALDVTNPANFSESNAASLVLWEFTDKDDADLGYTFAAPQIAKMANGKWAVIVGNGYNNTTGDGNASTTGNAVLYILFADGPSASGTWTKGTHYVKLTTKAGSAANPKGLSTPLAVDTNGDGVTDYIYAGDLRGNVWSFNVKDTNPSNWAVALGTTSSPDPLFVAKDTASTPNRQPITASVAAARHPLGGLMISFATGSYISPCDTNNTSPCPAYTAQSAYGVWDKLDGTTTVARSELVTQTKVSEAQLGTTTYRKTSSNPIDWTTKRGWVFDLPDTGERSAYDTIVRNENAIVTSLVPSLIPCDAGGYSWSTEFNIVTGAAPAQAVFDLDNDGVFESSSKKLKVGISPAPTFIPLAGKKVSYQYHSGSKQLAEETLTDEEKAKKKCQGLGSIECGVHADFSQGRNTWREIIKK
jgi:type IV pilus assembly protein PilY1